MYSVVMATVLSAGLTAPGWDDYGSDGVRRSLEDLKRSVEQLRKEQHEQRVDELKQTIKELRSEKTDQRLEELRRSVEGLRRGHHGHPWWVGPPARRLMPRAEAPPPNR